MKRFWKTAEAVQRSGGWGVTLDGKPIRTPAKAELVVPSAPLAKAIATEWNNVDDSVDPRRLPLTGIANAAIDHVAPQRQAFAATLERYAQGELACYRAESPKELADRQCKHWDWLLTWGRRRFDVDFRVTSGIMHVDQPAATIERLSHALSILDPFRLAGLSPLVTIGGSLLAALAVLESALPADAAWSAVTVDDQWQLDQWGADPEAIAALEARREDFFSAARFLELLRDGS